jgi:hypothetical protein
MSHRPLLEELQTGILPWRDLVIKHTREALELPVDRIQRVVKEWAGRTQAQAEPGASSSVC